MTAGALVKDAELLVVPSKVINHRCGKSVLRASPRNVPQTAGAANSTTPSKKRGEPRKESTSSRAEICCVYTSRARDQRTHMSRMADTTTDTETPRAIIVGAGLAGLVAAYELTQRGVSVVMVEQETRANLGGQAFFSLGGLFCVDSSEQRRWGIKDSRALALGDWLGTAQFDRLDGDDRWPRQWAEAFVDFATGELEQYVKRLGLRFLSVGWAERGDGTATGHGNSVPRFHLTWGTGPEVVRIFAEPVEAAEKRGLVTFRHRHMVDRLLVDETTGRAVGVTGRVLAADEAVPRGQPTSRVVVDTFEIRGAAVLVAAGGIGGNVEMVRQAWPVARLGPRVPQRFVVGVPAHVDGRMMGIAEQAGAHTVNRDRMWHYTEGLQNWDPIWSNHGIRVLPGPSSLWLDATGKRLPPSLFPGSDTLATLRHICATGHDYSWFVLDRAIVAREFALSGSEQNPDITDKSYWQALLQRVLSRRGTVPVQQFCAHGADFVVRDSLEDLVDGMNELARTIDGPLLDHAAVRAVVEARDAQLDNPYSKDAQAMLVRNARLYWYDRLTRVAAPHRLLDPRHGPLIAVRMNLLTRKTLGGIETDLQSRVQRPDHSVFPGLYAAGEIAGFGGGGVHGYAALEGTFLGGCIFSGRAAGRAMADEILGSVHEG
ncbi:3-ketosteroid-delta-1-dehydrogenase [Grosmannia clavigera kw1407]|uniref:3-ketosteroid-delta-1-dehydrogenase n=1 Tax=Grosmannia clavigera (strain kw1407 / UAMH 11150) TaxID=655863 RepID=F0XP45_GROCL|nr:3-ketosteroid-delta-1-dehydrogenase [Grosmannia clavigera kw1407]EFX00213.1 3-ketosteroid-delta-1-dehydrogenase [Grosmannia clavigera kw1407]